MAEVSNLARKYPDLDKSKWAKHGQNRGISAGRNGQVSRTAAPDHGRGVRGTKMSEFQYYEFDAIDRPLSASHRAAPRDHEPRTN